MKGNTKRRRIAKACSKRTKPGTKAWGRCVKKAYARGGKRKASRKARRSGFRCKNCRRVRRSSKR